MNTVLSQSIILLIISLHFLIIQFRMVVYGEHKATVDATRLAWSQDPWVLKIALAKFNLVSPQIEKRLRFNQCFEVTTKLQCDSFDHPLEFSADARIYGFSSVSPFVR